MVKIFQNFQKNFWKILKNFCLNSICLFIKKSLNASIFDFWNPMVNRARKWVTANNFIDVGDDKLVTLVVDKIVFNVVWKLKADHSDISYRIFVTKTAETVIKISILSPSANMFPLYHALNSSWYSWYVVDIWFCMKYSDSMILVFEIAPEWRKSDTAPSIK